jgi:hypothetical protein
MNCPRCSTQLAENGRAFCGNCGLPMKSGVDPANTMTGTELTYSVVTVLLIMAAAAMLIWGFFGLGGVDSAIQQSAIFAAGAVLGILARIAQAARQGLEDRRLRR